MLRSNDPAKERILVTGIYGVGKTEGWVSIARWYRRLETPARFHVLDTDNTTLRTLSTDDDWERNVTRYDIDSWDRLVETTEHLYEQADENDWLIVDSIDWAWQAVQDYFTMQVFGENSADYFLQVRRAGQSGHPLSSEYGVNWQVINKLYQRWIMRVIRWPGHVYACTPSQPVAEPNLGGKGGDSKEIRETFGRFGVRPAGQKNLGFQFHTVLLMQYLGDSWTITSLKDRSRRLLVSEPVIDFVVTYLLGVAGWQST